MGSTTGSHWFRGKDSPLPTPNQRSWHTRTCLKECEPLLSLLLLLLVCSSITTAPLLTITANWQKWILQLGDKSEAWTGMSAQGLISSSLSDPAEYWAMRCQINFLSLAGSWVWLPSKLPRVKRYRILTEEEAQHRRPPLVQFSQAENTEPLPCVLYSCALSHSVQEKQKLTCLPHHHHRLRSIWATWHGAFIYSRFCEYICLSCAVFTATNYLRAAPL